MRKGKPQYRGRKGPQTRETQEERRKTERRKKCH